MGIQIRHQDILPAEKTKHISSLTKSEFARNLLVFNPSIDDIDFLLSLAEQEIPGLANPDVVERVFIHNPETLWAISKSKQDHADLTWPDGFFAILPLTDSGASAIATGKFKGNNPDLSHICRQWEQPVAIYFWCIYAPGRLATALSWWRNLYRSPKFDGLPIFAKASTPAGAKFFERLGFKTGASWNGVTNLGYISRTHIQTESRSSANSTIKSMPGYENYARSYGLSPDTTEISCSVARTFEDLLRAMSIRSVVYIGDQKCPFNEEWDGNDLAAIHLIARQGDEPIGTIRIRCFAGAAKIERLAVLPTYRKSRAAFRLVRAAEEIAQKMGYSKVFGHAHANVMKFWRMFGYKKIAGRENFNFSDHECIQVEKNLPPMPDAIGWESDPLVSIRPVGRWHVAGPLDKSALRPATNVEKDEPETTTAFAVPC